LDDEVHVVIIYPDGGKIVWYAEGELVFASLQAHDWVKPEFADVFGEEVAEF